MSLPKIVITGAIVIFSLIGITALVKKPNNESKILDVGEKNVQEIVIETPKEFPVQEKPINKQTQEVATVVKSEEEKTLLDEVPEVDILDRLFATDSSRLPIVETLSYTSRVPWLKGRPAWIADYASYYSTTRHFIARSLNRKADYYTQKVAPGDRFNVLKKDKNINFYLLIDLSKSKLWFYYIDLDNNERTLLKTYKVGLGRKDAKRKSGYLTPIGKYKLGSKVAIYKPGTMGYFQDQKIEMIRIFGSRWIPFEEEIENCSESSKGLGIHGSPWIDSSSDNLVEDLSKIGKYESDGCIRLSAMDIEEVFAIIISKPATIEIVNDFHQATLPGNDTPIN